MDNYDMAVIGSGPAGQRAAGQAAKKGKKVVVIDRREHKLGGVSLHAGTIPSKTLREAVLYLKGVRRRKIYGPSRRLKDDITLNDLMERVDVIMEYEIPKYDGGLGSPSVFVPLADATVRRKIDLLMSAFETQYDKSWFTPETFLGLMRLRGIECNAPDGYAEAFYSRKLVLGTI